MADVPPSTSLALLACFVFVLLVSSKFVHVSDAIIHALDCPSYRAFQTKLPVTVEGAKVTKDSHGILTKNLASGVVAIVDNEQAFISNVQRRNALSRHKIIMIF